MTSDRRSFLTRLMAGGGLAGLAPLADAHEAAMTSIRSDPGAHDARSYALEPGLLYLNHASVGTIPRTVLDAHRRYLQVQEGNPWEHVWGPAWEGTRNAVRARAARLIGAEPPDVALVPSTTFAFNLLATGLALGPGDEVVFPHLNHPGASKCFEALEARGSGKVRRVRVPEVDDPRMSPDALTDRLVALVDDRTRVLVLPAIDNQLGIRHPVEAVARRLRAKHPDLVIAVDAAQSVGMHPIDMRDSAIDFLATSAHKWTQGPKPSGFVWMKPALRKRLPGLVVTWGWDTLQGRSALYEAQGTPDLPNALTLGHAIDYQLMHGVAARWERIRSWRRLLLERLDDHPRIALASPHDEKLASAVLTLAISGGSAPDVARQLFKKHRIILRPFTDASRQLLRLSPNSFQSPADLDRLFTALDPMLR